MRSENRAGNGWRTVMRSLHRSNNGRIFAAEQKNVRTKSFFETNYEFESTRGVNAGGGVRS